MAERARKIRLFVDAPLAPGAALELSAQAHYLTAVMRTAPGETIEIFNGRDGAWSAQITDQSRKRVHLALLAQSGPQVDPPDLWLLFAPLKKARTDFIVEKATELGAARLQPVITEYTNAERVRPDRLTAHAREAAEQCGGTFVPEIAPPVPLKDITDAWPDNRRLMFCDERRTAPPAKDALRSAHPGPWAILIGPEGGFSPAETTRLHAMTAVLPVSLGPRILRADTAAAAALTAWQMHLGDW